jgi:hypothetical protein
MKKRNKYLFNSKNSIKEKLISLIIISFLTFISGTTLLYAVPNVYDLAAFDWKSIKIPMKTGSCIYQQAGQDVEDFSRFTLDRLVQSAKQNESKCAPLVDLTKSIQTSMNQYFMLSYAEKGIRNPEDAARLNGDNSIRLTCYNMEDVFQIQLFNYRQYAFQKILLDVPTENIFYGRCQDETTKVLINGYPTLDACLQEKLVEILLNFRNECNKKNQDNQNMAEKWRQKIRSQEILAGSVYSGIQKIFELVKSEQCRDIEDISKAAVQTAVTIGANIVGANVGNPAGRVGASIGAETINFMIDYMQQFSDRRRAIQNLVVDRNYENSVCMWISLQEKLCQQYSFSPPEKKSQGGSCILRNNLSPRPSHAISDILLKSFARSPVGVTKESPEQLIYVDYFEDFIKKFEVEPISLGDDSNPKTNLKDFFSEALGFYKETSPSEFNEMLNIQQNIVRGKNYLSDYKILQKHYPNHQHKDVQVILKKLKTEVQPNVSLEKGMELMLEKTANSFKDIQSSQFVKLMEKYAIFKTKGNDELQKILAEETALDIYKNISSKMDNYLDNIDQLQDLNNGSIELLKPVFEERLKERSITSLKNARKAEKTHLNVNSTISPDDLLKRRRFTFAQLRDSIKDCLSTQGMFFTNRKRFNFLEGYFRQPQMSANLDVLRRPKEYLKACAPFLCDEGIPLPKLPNKNEAPIEFQNYMCKIQNDSSALIKKMQQTYLDHGTICGKSIQDWTQGRFDFIKYNPFFRNVDELKNRIINP